MTGQIAPPLRFLIVEDEALLAFDIAMMIEDAGHTVVAEAASLSEVQALRPDLSPNIAFVDVQLAEGSNGIDVCAHIRRHWNNAVIIFVTANPKKIPDDYAGGHGVLSKPFSRSSLMSALRYIEEGICNPPPSSMKPHDFTVAPGLAAAWMPEAHG